eukprot:843041-Rhodomonas_salina.4
MTFVNLFTTAARPEIASVHKSGTKLKLRAAWKSVGPAAPIRTRPVHTQISPHTPGYPGRHGYLLVQTKLEPKWVPTDWYSRKYSYKAYLFGVPCSVRHDTLSSVGFVYPGTRKLAIPRALIWRSFPLPFGNEFVCAAACCKEPQANGPKPFPGLPACRAIFRRGIPQSMENFPRIFVGSLVVQYRRGVLTATASDCGWGGKERGNGRREGGGEFRRWEREPRSVDSRTASHETPRLRRLDFEIQC